MIEYKSLKESPQEIADDVAIVLKLKNKNKVAAQLAEHKELNDAKLPFVLNELTNSITFSKSQEPQLEEQLKTYEERLSLACGGKTR
jgi:hypothetical protein